MRFVSRLLVVLPLAVLAVGLTASRSFGDEKLKDVACRSVHLGYTAPKGVAFYNEITIDKSAAGTYFMVCGWNKGYFGMQELGNGKKLLIFSVWDSGQNDPKKVDEDKRTKLIHKHEKMRIGRFGGEGTGGQSFFDYDWKLGETYKFMVTAKLNGDRTEYSGYFFLPESKTWEHLVTFSTLTGGQYLSGYYSFIEDFKRDRVSATKNRQAHFGNGWVKPVEGDWVPTDKAQFTADANPVLNVDAGQEGARFFLSTGGDVKNVGTKLWARMELPADAKRKAPEGLPDFAK